MAASVCTVPVMLTDPVTVLEAGKLPTFTVPFTGSGVLTTLTFMPAAGPGSAARAIVGAHRTTRLITHRTNGKMLSNLVIVVPPYQNDGVRVAIPVAVGRRDAILVTCS